MQKKPNKQYGVGTWLLKLPVDSVESVDRFGKGHIVEEKISTLISNPFKSLPLTPIHFRIHEFCYLNIPLPL